jgi:hypothetical protein
MDFVRAIFFTPVGLQAGYFVAPAAQQVPAEHKKMGCPPVRAYKEDGSFYLPRLRNMRPCIGQAPASCRWGWPYIGASWCSLSLLLALALAGGSVRARKTR